MNNQAAQTMPTLPRPYWKAGDVKDDYGNPYNETDLFTDDDMRAMYQQGYAAALSQTAGVVVSDEMIERACKKYAFREDGAVWPDAYSEHEVTAERTLMREFLEHVLAAAPAASGGVDTNPAPGHDVDEYLSDYVRIAHLIGSIFFYGNFKAETFNERELEILLRKVGRFYESEEQVISGEPAVERPLHFATENLIRRFSDALREKLSAAEKKYGYSDGWASPDWMDECRKHLMQHIAKGDPRDVAAYCAFLWHHGESTTPQPPSAASVSERARDDLHVAICQAVALMNMEPMTTPGLLQAHDILRKAIS